MPDLSRLPTQVDLTQCVIPLGIIPANPAVKMIPAATTPQQIAALSPSVTGGEAVMVGNVPTLILTQSDGTEVSISLAAIIPAIASNTVVNDATGQSVINDATGSPVQNQ